MITLVCPVQRRLTGPRHRRLQHLREQRRPRKSDMTQGRGISRQDTVDAAGFPPLIPSLYHREYTNGGNIIYTKILNNIKNTSAFNGINGTGHDFC